MDIASIIEDRPDEPTWEWNKTYKAWVLEVYTQWGITQHLSIERHDGREITAKWDVLQRIKNDMLGGDIQAVEVYPPECRVINEVNRRHLWAVPLEILSIGFTAR